jgi:PAS domain S-box-containing protein
LRQAAIAGMAGLILSQTLLIALPGRSAGVSLFSNLTVLLLALAAAAACLRARQRAEHTERALWTLFASAFFLWSTGQGAWTFYENWLCAPMPTPSVGHFLFRLFGLPLAMVFFLDEEADQHGVNWVRIADFAQIGIAFLFFYFELYFDREANLSARPVLGFLDISDAENWLIAVALLLLAGFSSSAVIRRVTRRMSLPIVVYAAASTLFNYVVTVTGDASSGRWPDVFWSLPFALAATLALSWEPLPAALERPVPRLPEFLRGDYAPVVLPLVVLVLSLYVAPQFRAIGVIAVIGSFGLFAARMLVVQNRLRKSAAAVRSSEERFATAFQASPNAIVIARIDPPTFMEVNRSFERLSGYTRAEAIGKNLSELNMWVDPAHREMWNGALREGRVIEGMEVPLRSKAGEIRWAVISAAFIEVGRRRCVLAIARDVTERRRAEEALRISEEKFSRAFQASPDPMMIADAETQKIVEVNDQYVHLTGYARDETIGRTGLELGMYETPEEREKLMAALKQHGRVHNLELRLRRKDGHVGVAWVSLEPIQVGGRACLLGIARDITQQKRAEDALRASEARYRDLTDNANDVIFTLDLEGNFTSFNRAGERVTGYQCQKGERVNISRVVVAEQTEFAQQMMARALRGDAPAPFDLDITAKDGRRLTLELSGRALLDNGRPVGIHCIARDVTERNLLEAQLRQAQKMEAVGLLAGGIAHDFNNLLSVIIGYSDLLSDEVKAESKAAVRLEQIRSAALRASSLTRQLLAFSRQQVLQPRVLDLNHVVTDMAKLLHRLIGEHIALITRLDPHIGRIQADPGQIEQVILNLAVNARDAMAAGGTMTIATSNMELDNAFCALHSNLTPGPFVQLVVSDTGVGMSKEVQARIFEPFFTTKEKGRGTGLGLSTAFGIVQQSGGHISVYSDVGHGATFKVYLPRVDQPAELHEAAQDQPRDVRGSETILVAEDEHPLRELIRQILEDRGYHVIPAADPKEAERLARENGSVQMLLTDVVMPGMNGRQLAESFLKLHPGAKVLFMSGYTDDHIVRQGVLEPPFAFVNKPITAAALCTRVRELLDA